MKRKSKHALIGIAFIAVSVFVIYFNMSFFEGGFKHLWPALVLLFGAFLYLYYFSTKKTRNRLFILFIATFIVISSIPLFVLAVTSFEYMNFLWPGFLFALGMGILALYVYGKNKKAVLVGSILTLSLSILIWVIYSLKSQFGLVIGVSLFIIGAAFLTRGLIKEEQEESPSATKQEDRETDEEES